MEVSEMIFCEITSAMADAVKNKFDTYVSGNSNNHYFFLDQTDHCMNDETISDTLVNIGFDEMQINELLYYRIWCFCSRD